MEKNYKDLNKNSLFYVILEEHVLQQVENLKANPSVTRAIKEKRLALHAWIYSIETGDLFSYDVKTSQFECIKHF